MEFLVTTKSQRPASTEPACFYCQSAIGDIHKPGCVLIRKKVKIRMIVEYDVSVPNHWTKEDVEFHRNECTWCSSNVIRELEELDKSEACLCAVTRFEYLEDIGGPELKEL